VTAATRLPTSPPGLTTRGSGFGTWQWDVPTDVVTWDDGMLSLFGLPPDARVPDYAGFLALVLAEDRATVDADVRRCLMTGADYEATFRIGLTNGATRVIMTRGAVYLDGDGRPARVSGVCWDGTAQRRADEALRKSEARYRGLVESQQDLVFRFDLDERVTFANDAYCTTFGLARDEVLGRGLTHLHPEDRAATTAAILSLLEPPHQGMVENRVRTPRGWRRISWSGCAIDDGHGTIVEIQCVGRDVTERSIAEESLRASNDELRASEERLRTLEQRATAVREDERRRLGIDLHDGVCQDLVGVALLVGALQSQQGVSPEARAQLSRIERHLLGVGDHLRRLAHDLRPMLLHELGLEGAIGSLVAGFSTGSTVVRASFGTGVRRLSEAIEIGVYRVVQEAVGNACRHGAPSEVVVTLDVDEQVRLEVRDDGVGFDLAARNGMHAFGLVTMEERARALSGRLEIASAPGRGTSVRFACPAS